MTYIASTHRIWAVSNPEVLSVSTRSTFSIDLCISDDIMYYLLHVIQ